MSEWPSNLRINSIDNLPIVRPKRVNGAAMTTDSETRTHTHTHTYTHTLTLTVIYTHVHKRAAGINDIAELDASAAVYSALF